jgi:hypothetical protein
MAIRYITQGDERVLITKSRDPILYFVQLYPRQTVVGVIGYLPENTGAIRAGLELNVQPIEDTETIEKIEDALKRRFSPKLSLLSRVAELFSKKLRKELTVNFI